MIERLFQDIADDKLTHADQQAFLVSLGWSNGVKWYDLMRSKRVLLISEAGAGKTHECQTQAQKLWDKGEPAFFIELANLASEDLRSLLSSEQERRLDAWLCSQSDIATFFLDSCDELKLSKGSFKQALNRLNRAINGQLHKVRIVITTRPIPLAEEVKLIHEFLPVPLAPLEKSQEEIFANIAINDHPKQSWPYERKEIEETPDWRTVALMPLSDQQIAEFASCQGIKDTGPLLTDLRKRNAQDFARRPQDLIELCADWRVHKRIRTHQEQVASNIRIKLQARDDRSEPAELSIDKAIEGASRLALAMLVTRRLTIRHSAASDDLVHEAAFDPKSILSDWSPLEIKALLERSLFGFASYGRVRFHHRSVLEYLAAERLKTLIRANKMTFKALKRLIFAEIKGKTIVKPSMRPVAGWLAITNSQIFELLRDNEPAVLLNEGDPEGLTISQRNQTLRAYVKRYGEGGWRGLHIPNIQIHRFASSELAKEINNLWAEDIENSEVKAILLAMIELGAITDCVDLARTTSRDHGASYEERMNALDALIALNDPLLTTIASEISTQEGSWTDNLVRGATLRLFPEHLSIEQLCQILSWLQPEGRDVIGFSWQLPSLIAHSKLSKTNLKLLRDSLVKLVSINLQCNEVWEPFTSDKSHLSSALSATCTRGLAIDTSDQWLSASVLALHLTEKNHRSDTAFKELTKQLSNLNSDARRRLFWIEDRLMQSFTATTDPRERLTQILHFNGVISLDIEKDLPWIKSVLGDTRSSKDDRAFMLELALYLLPRNEKYCYPIAALKPLIFDQPDFLAKVEKHLQPKELSDWEKDALKRKKQQDRDKTKNRTSWIRFWREIARDPDKAFSSEQSLKIFWNLWRVMSRAGEYSQASGWNRRFIEEQFNKEIADKLRSALKEIWRKDKPTFPSERSVNERTTYLERWLLGLAAIYAEAEDPEWAVKLTEQEAELAVRYAPLELNGLPFWIEQLMVVHRHVVVNVLGQEINWSLGQGNTWLLQELMNCQTELVKSFLTVLHTWVSLNKSHLNSTVSVAGYTEQLRRVINILLKHGDEKIHLHLGDIAQEVLKQNLSKELVFIWLSTLLKVNPNMGIVAFEEKLKAINSNQQSEAIAWFSNLLGEDRESLIACENLSPTQVLHLLRLAYTYVRPEDDNVHEGAFRPNTRDYAEQVRSYIFKSLLSSTGEAGWQAKLELIDDPLFVRLKDHIRATAEESLAQEVDSEVFNEQQALALDKTGEHPPSTNSAMFALLKDRLSDLDDLLLSDISPREFWATTTEEKLIRREIARELRKSANNLYTVDQEAATADEKETDIRLRSTHSNHEAIIELKIGDSKKSTARVLRDTIKKQLVEKYMSAESSRSGCLLITLAKDRKWENPDTNKKEIIGLEDLKILLNEEAKRVMESMGGTVSILIHILDLRPRVSTEKK
jgi:hypothetical protein